MDFLVNKYTRWYFQIINNPDVSGYVEKHHILPRCMGGGNESANKVKLSARQHFVCHLLLIRMTDDKKFRGKLCYALKCMVVWHTSSGQRYHPKSSRLFELARRAHKGIPKSEETKRKISIAKTGKKLGPHTEETKRKISNSQRGKFIPADVREKTRIALQGKETWMKGRTHSAESIQKMSNSQKGHNRGRGKSQSKAAVEANKQAQLKRTYFISSPSGEEFQIKDLKSFCAEKNLPYQTLADAKNVGRTISDHHNLKMKNAIGWTVFKMCKENFISYDAE